MNKNGCLCVVLVKSFRLCLKHLRCQCTKPQPNQDLYSVFYCDQILKLVQKINSSSLSAHFQKYTLNICWIQNTYYIPMSSPVPEGDTREHEITYYQYVPLILLMSAFCFKVRLRVKRHVPTTYSLSLTNYTPVT